MPRRKGFFTSGAYYHIFNRVIEGEVLFRDRGNYLYCIDLMKRNGSKYRNNVIAYCLMPNHYHFLLEQKSNQPISTFVSVLYNAYVQKVNQLWGRRGPLFRGCFRHVLVEREEYLIHLCRYIHLNPVEAGIVQNPEEWPYSNYLEWINKRSGDLQDPEFIQTYFRSAQDYQGFVLDFDVESKFEKQLSSYLLE